MMMHGHYFIWYLILPDDSRKKHLDYSLWQVMELWKTYGGFVFDSTGKCLKKDTDFIKSNVSDETHMYVDQNVYLTLEMCDRMDERGWTAKKAAENLDFSYDEFTNMLLGLYNYSLKQLIKIQLIFNIKLCQ